MISQQIKSDSGGQRWGWLVQDLWWPDAVEEIPGDQGWGQLFLVVKQARGPADIWGLARGHFSGGLKPGGLDHRFPLNTFLATRNPTIVCFW